MPEHEETQDMPPDMPVPEAKRAEQPRGRIGAKIGDYYVENELGRGGMGVVYRARQAKLNRQVALKMQVWEDFLNMPGMLAWRDVVQTHLITALFAGHTHYGQVANDGRHVYVAVRSIGEPEGGAAGYAVVHLDGDDLAMTYRTMGESGPVVLITHPRRLIMATTGAHIVSGPVQARIRAWSKSPITAAQGRIDDGAWTDLHSTGALAWSFPIPGDTLPKGEHTMEVRLTDASNAEGSDRLTFLCDRSGRYNPFPMVEPVVRETKFC
jgi:hypothetical protein